MKSFFWKESPHNLEGSTMYSDYFVTIVHNSNKISKKWTPNNFVIMLVLVIPQTNTTSVLFAVNLRYHIISGVIRIIF